MPPQGHPKGCQCEICYMGESPIRSNPTRPDWTTPEASRTWLWSTSAVEGAELSAQDAAGVGKPD